VFEHGGWQLYQLLRRLKNSHLRNQAKQSVKQASRNSLRQPFAPLAFPAGIDDFTPMLDWSQCPAVERIPGKVSGAWLFKGTRVPVKALFENLEGGATVKDFLNWFPGVTAGQVEAVLKYAERSLEAA
jgi:uncharacterized protein (DUF433 family)